MAGFLAVAAAAAVAVAAVLRLVYLRLLPRPIPGIPCNKDSTTRLMGDAPYFIELGKSGAFWITFFTDLLARHNTPIAQYFTGPLSGSHVVVADYREARDLMTKRGKDLARGSKNNHVWQGVLPEHFIAMEDFHPSFKHAKFLTKDLMTPSFLHGVSWSLLLSSCHGQRISALTKRIRYPRPLRIKQSSTLSSSGSARPSWRMGCRSMRPRTWRASPTIS